MNNIILYSTHCPKCNVLSKKLKDSNIDYVEVTDAEIMIDKGFMTVPMLEVDGVVMDFITANNWINERGNR